ncbi:hypothetical protein CWE15_00580 [Aliidiomarina taiwanensis]|uniref:Uncharacterized protein n=1 Tax=Aliidiomarina taiwanensis TaxID=946228 RepID=A0A432X8K9_9GAMM|nr:hypothetical protein CWE15_00580 [Aliidiomarina taiwanensis]
MVRIKYIIGNNKSQCNANNKLEIATPHIIRPGKTALCWYANVAISAKRHVKDAPTTGRKDSNGNPIDQTTKSQSSMTKKQLLCSDEIKNFHTRVLLVILI